MNYDGLIITNLPNYYKNNLFNEIAKRCNILVVFIAATELRRNADFLSIEKENFDYEILGNSLDNRNHFSNCIKLYRVMRSHSFARVIIGDWVNLESWFILLFSRKQNTAMMLESNIHSVQGFGIKEYFKKFFLSRLSMVFANGQQHEELARLLGYKGRIENVKGLGIIKYNQVPDSHRANGFLFVGRLATEKNLELLIEIFNNLPYKLTIVGEGPEEDKLKKMAGENIVFKGYVNNSEMGSIYKSHRALILISTHEPYGLVAEESLYHGRPVILSAECGIVDTLCFHETNSLVVDSSSDHQIINAIKTISDDAVYEKLLSNIDPKQILLKNEKMVDQYVEEIKNLI